MDYRILTFIISLIFSSCIRVFSLQPEVCSLDDLIATKKKAPIQLVSNTAFNDETYNKTYELLQGELTLDKAVTIGVFNSPRLQSIYTNLGIARADIIQSGLFENPQFDAEIHFEGSGIGSATNLNLTQNIISILQIPLKAKVAKAAYEKVKSETAYEVMNFLYDVKTAYYKLLGDQMLYKVRNRAVEIMEGSFMLTERIYQAGNTPALQYATEQALLQKAKLELIEAKTEVDQQKEKINALLGLYGKNTKWNAVGNLLNDFSVSIEKLETVAVKNRFDLQALYNEITVYTENLHLTENFRFLPDLALGIDIEGEENGKILPGPNIAFPLPVFDWGEGKVAEAQYRVKKAVAEYLQKAIEIRSEVRSARNNLLSAKAQAKFIRQHYIPSTQKALLETQKQFNGMLTGVFTLIQAKQNEIEAEVLYVQNLQRFWISKAELERAIGRDFERT